MLETGGRLTLCGVAHTELLVQRMLQIISAEIKNVVFHKPMFFCCAIFFRFHSTAVENKAKLRMEGKKGNKGE